MGRVYLAYDSLLQRTVALKVILMKHTKDPAVRQEFKDRFFREARIGAKLQHANIVAIFDLGEFKGRPYIVMEHVKGQPLDEMLISDEPDVLQALDLLEQMASALDTAHEQGIVHRDIKPSNAVVTPEGKVKILDFGMARLTDSKMTKTGEFLGTPRYSSPEQVAGKPVDGRSDLFSLAVVAHELITGESPFPGDSISAILYKIAMGSPVIAPCPRETGVDEDMVQAVFKRAFAVEPDQRYQTGTAFVSALREALTSREKARVKAEAEDFSDTPQEQRTMSYPIAFWNNEKPAQAPEPDAAPPPPEPVVAKSPSPPPPPVPAPPVETIQPTALMPTANVGAPPIDVAPPPPKPAAERKFPLALILGALAAFLVIVTIILVIMAGGKSKEKEEEQARREELLTRWAAVVESGDLEVAETVFGDLQNEGLADKEHEQALETLRQNIRANQAEQTIQTLRTDFEKAAGEDRLEDAAEIIDRLASLDADTVREQETLDQKRRDLTMVLDLRKQLLDAFKNQRVNIARKAIDDLKALNVDVSAEEAQLERLIRTLAKTEKKETPPKQPPVTPPKPVISFKNLAKTIDDDLRTGMITRAKLAIPDLEKAAVTQEQKQQVKRLKQLTGYPQLRVLLADLQGVTFRDAQLYRLQSDFLAQGEKNLLELADQYRRGGKEYSADEVLALGALRLAAEHGDPQAAYMMGNFWRIGRLVSENWNEAVKWYTKSAEGGFANAQLFMGELYYHGQYVEKDQKKAFAYFMDAAQQGQGKAQYWVGKCYEWGVGTKPSKITARSWYNIAAQNGVKEAREALDRLKDQ